MQKAKSFNQALNAYLNGHKVEIHLRDDKGNIVIKTPLLINEVLSVYFARLVNTLQTDKIKNITYYI